MKSCYYVYKKSVILHDSPLTFGIPACKIDSVWCTLPVLMHRALRFIDNRRFEPGYAFCTLRGFCYDF